MGVVSMKITITFLHLDHTESLDQRIKDKSEKLGKYFEAPIHIKWTCSVRNGDHFAEVKLFSPKNTYLASAKSSSMYKSLDLVLEKVEKQVTKTKEKIKNKIHRKNSSPQIMDDPDAVWTEYKDAA